MLVKRDYKRLSVGDYLFVFLMIAGGANWTMMGLFNINMFEMLFGRGSYVDNVFSILVGLSSLYVVTLLFKIRKKEEAQQHKHPALGFN